MPFTLLEDGRYLVRGRAGVPHSLIFAMSAFLRRAIATYNLGVA